ncbi:MAG: PUR family DNA/RNA-binding protein [Paludibacteraceae bacterium]|nr:PUR family DNA/RNA-binding protein [Paludibacteraceae bacterium]
MEEVTKPQQERAEREIVFSKAIKAGKRIYYLDVKKSRNEEMFLSVTESKKKVVGDDASQVLFEKHKIFLYKEDFEKFMDGMREVIDFIKRNQESDNHVTTNDLDINFDI